MPDDFDILTRGVENLQHLFVSHQFEERLEVDARRQRVDHDRFLRARHLHDAKQRIIGGLSQEFGIDGDDRVFREPGANRGEFRGGGNQIHERSITLLRRRSAESADMSRVLRRIRALHFRNVVSFSPRLSHRSATAGSPDPVNTAVLSVDRSGVADVPGRPSPRRNGKHDDAQREHRQSHEFEHQCIGHSNSPNKPIDLSRND